MTDDDKNVRAFNLLAMTRDIVCAAAASRNISDLAMAIKEVHTALSFLDQPEPEPEIAPVAKVTKAKSVTPDTVTCMHCGVVMKSLKRHIGNVHSQTPEAYREFWNLPADHPIVAPNYSAKRSQLAKDHGLGRKVGA